MTCEWFYGCDEPASGEPIKHPTIGPVPICSHHRDWLGDTTGGPQWLPPIVARHLSEDGVYRPIGRRWGERPPPPDPAPGWATSEFPGWDG